MSDQRIRIAVINDEPLFRRGAAEAFLGHANFEVVAEAPNGAPALEAILGLEPDVAVLDGSVPEVELTHLLREMTRRGTSTRILILTPAGNSEAAQAALASGVFGYLTKRIDGMGLRSAVTLVAEGSTVISEEFKLSVAQALERTATRAHNPLSSREQDVLERVARGWSAKEIAADLYISEASVKTCLGRTYDKLGVSAGTAAVAEAIDRNLITYSRAAPPDRSLLATA